MSFLKEMLAERKLPPLKTREEMLGILLENEYGFLPEAPSKVDFEEEIILERFCAGKAVLKKVTTNCVFDGKFFSFPFYATIPVNQGQYPFFVHINFRPDVPDRFLPAEELVDNGYAILSVCHNEITTDDGDFTKGLAGVLYDNGKREKAADPGKIAMWAWAAQRVMDYACLHEEIFDLNRSVVCGHSRLGKTALLAAATDERFRFVYSNEAGCSGDALSRKTTGETVADILTQFPYWFCENYKKYSHRESEMPFDQHYLLSSIAPRFVCVGSAEKDAWADPVSQYLCCVAASPVFDRGFKNPDRFPEPGEMFLEGNIGFHLRSGTHYFSREDWHRLMEFIEVHTR